MTPPVTVATITSASGKRMHPRVRLPLTVELDGREYQARDLSLGGFGLDGDGPCLPVGATLPAALGLSALGSTTVLETSVRVAWRAGAQARGFQFIGLSPEHARLIDHVVRKRLAGELTELGDTGGSGNGGSGVALRMPTSLGPPRLLSALRGATVLLLSAAALCVAAAYAGSRLLTVNSDYAAVASTLRQLRAAQPGYLENSALVVGARLRPGQLVGSIRPAASPQARLEIESRAAALRVTLAQQSTEAAAARAGFENLLRTARSELQAAGAQRALLEAQASTAQRMFQRSATLATTGAGSQDMADAQTLPLLQSQQELAAARDREVAARERLASAEAGRFVSDGRSTQKSPADIERDMAATRAQLERLDALRAGLEEPLPVHSPCDCTVSAVSATPNVFVAPGDPIADLAEAGGGPAQVDALVQNQRVALVTVGQRARVYLASRPDAQPGRVTAVNFNPANAGRTGLPDALRTSDAYGLVTVTLDARAEGLQPGLPAVVMAPVDRHALLRGVPTLAWAREFLRGWVAEARARVAALKRVLTPAPRERDGGGMAANPDGGL